VEIDQVTKKIIGCAYTVGNTLGAGFLEKVYQNALAHEIRKSGLKLHQQAPIKITYDEIIVGEHFVDLLVENTVIVELKAVKELDNSHMAQCLNYLKATNLKVCLLINFGKPRVQIKRIVN
jgi:GxxExxY protein